MWGTGAGSCAHHTAVVWRGEAASQVPATIRGSHGAATTEATAPNIEAAGRRGGGGGGGGSLPSANFEVRSMQVWALRRTMPTPSPYLAETACTSFFAMISSLPTAWAAKQSKRGLGNPPKKPRIVGQPPVPLPNCTFIPFIERSCSCRARRTHLQNGAAPRLPSHEPRR